MENHVGIKTNTSLRSVWGGSISQSRSKNHLVGNTENRRQTPALNRRLVAYTSTGAVFASKAKLAAVSLPAGLALIQELAARSLNKDAHVVSSMANRVSGETALSAWAQTCGYAVAPLIGAPPAFRLNFLNALLAYLRQQGNANGIEPIVGAAVNGAWPWIDAASLTSILTITSRYMKESEFAAKNVIPILDPNTRSFTVFAPGSLATADLSEWREWKTISRGALSGTAVTGANENYGMGGLLGSGVHSGLDLSGLSGSGANGTGSTGNGLYGSGGLLGPGSPGHHGPDLSGLPGGGAEGSGSGGIYGSGGLLGQGVPGHQGLDLGGLTGSGGSGLGNGLHGPGGLLGPGTPGYRGVDLSNLGGNGGPYGFGASLGAGGASGWDSVEKMGSSMQKAGYAAMALGGSLIVGGAGVTVASGGAGAPLGGAMASGGAEILVIGLIGVGVGMAAEALGSSMGSQGPTATEPPSGTSPTPQSGDSASGTPGSTPAPTEPAPDEPKPEEPHDGDLYPDPDGGGRGNPNQLPDFEGGSGGPTTLWDEHGGGGNPTTLWDENGGGGNPTTIAAHFDVTALAGRGLLSNLVQVGPSTFAF